MRKLLAVLLVIIFVPLILINVLVYGLKSTILDPLYLKDRLAASQTYSKIIEAGIPLLSQTLDKSGQDESDQTSQNILVQAATSTLNANWLEKQFDQVFLELNKYLNGQNNSLNIKIDLKEVKKSFTGAFSQSALQGITDLPECTQEELKKMDQDNQEIKCLPPGFSKEEISQATKEMFSGNQQNQQSDFLNQLPDEYDLGQIITQSYWPVLQQAKLVLNYLQLGLMILTGVNILLLVLIGLLIGKPMGSLLRWLAISLLIPSIILLSLAVFGYLANKIFLPGLSIGLLPEINSLATSVIISLLEPLQIKIILIAGSGLLLAIIAYIIAHFLKKAPNIKTVKEEKNK